MQKIAEKTSAFHSLRSSHHALHPCLCLCEELLQGMDSMSIVMGELPVCLQYPPIERKTLFSGQTCLNKIQLFLETRKDGPEMNIDWTLSKLFIWYSCTIWNRTCNNMKIIWTFIFNPHVRTWQSEMFLVDKRCHIHKLAASTPMNHISGQHPFKIFFQKAFMRVTE